MITQLPISSTANWNPTRCFKLASNLSLKVADLTSVTDHMVIACGTSNRHVKSLADNVIDKCKKQGIRPLGIEGTEKSEWVLVDLGDVVAHIMLPATRQFYDLERLWEVDSPVSTTEHI